MPGNLEAPPILPEHAYGVKQKSTGNPYPTMVSGDERSTTKPESRAPKAAKRTLDAGARNPTDPAHNGTGPRPSAGALRAAKVARHLRRPAAPVKTTLRLYTLRHPAGISR
jgi:hypothetical protein